MASLYEAILLEDVPKEEEVRTDETLPTSLSFDENIIRDSQYNSLKEEDERLAPDALVLQNVKEQLKSLGFFKGKEKKALQARIDELGHELEQLTTSIEEEKDPIQKRIDEIVDGLKTLDNQICAITIELIKER